MSNKKCRVCVSQLEVGINWTHYQLDNNQYICKKCKNDESYLIKQRKKIENINKTDNEILKQRTDHYIKILKNKIKKYLNGLNISI